MTWSSLWCELALAFELSWFCVTGPRLLVSDITKLFVILLFALLLAVSFGAICKVQNVLSGTFQGGGQNFHCVPSRREIRFLRQSLLGHSHFFRSAFISIL